MKTALFTSSDKFAITIEKRDGSPSSIRGYAAVFYDDQIPDQTQYMLSEMYAERIFPGAFRKVLSENQDVRALFNHDSNYVLGRTKNGTLQLREDDKGLVYIINPPDTQRAKDIIEGLRRGDISGSSFSFSLKRQDTGIDDVSMGPNQYRDEGNLLVREIREFDQVYDVGPVTFPAYTGTTAAMRHEDPESAKKDFDAEIARREEVKRQEQQKRMAQLADFNKRIQGQ